MRLRRLLSATLLALVPLALVPFAQPAEVSAQAKEVTGVFTINKTPAPLTNAYAFARRSGSGADNGVLLLFTSAPVPPDAIRGYMNNSWWNTKALAGELTAIEVIVSIPEHLQEARAAGGKRNCCQVNFYDKRIITEDKGLSISGTQALTLTQAPAGRIAGRIMLPETKNAPNFGNGTTLAYDLTFDTKLLTAPSFRGPWAD